MCKGPSEGPLERVKVITELQNQDLAGERQEFLFSTPLLTPLATRLLKDERDVPMLNLMLNLVFFTVPGVCIVMWLGMDPSRSALVRHGAGLVYLVLMLVVFMERCILCLHFASHKGIFKSQLLSDTMNGFIAMCFGIPPGLYGLHHVTMHHLENNHGLDISETENYQRDSLRHFLWYFVRFVLFIRLELPYYAFRTGRYAACATTLSFMILSMIADAALLQYVSFSGTLWTRLIIHFVAMTAMSFGNWSQHMFIDPENVALAPSPQGKPRQNNYVITYNCIDTWQNKRCFNDGYHIIHHQSARLHWTELPTCFHNTLDTHLKHGAITFRDIHFFDVGLLVMAGWLHRLAEHYVHLGPADTAPTKDQVVEILRARLKPVPQEGRNEPARKKVQ